MRYLGVTIRLRWRTYGFANSYECFELFEGREDRRGEGMLLQFAHDIPI